VLCTDANGKLKAFTKVQKVCTADPKGIVLGHVKNSERKRKAGGPETCALIKKQN
jgi:hypothetical protein